MANRNSRAGWRLNAWLAEVDFSRTKYYQLPEELKPPSVDLDGMRIILEAPRAYLRRIAAAQRGGSAPQ